MQPFHNTTFDIRILSIALLAGLLLVAPCKVRNSLERSLGLEKSEVSNKLKTTVSVESCASYEAVQLTEGTPTDAQGMVTVLLRAVSMDSFDTTLNSENSFFATQQHKVASVVPLYILYRQFKIYS